MHRVTLGGVELAVLDARDSVASLLTSIEAVRGLALVLSILSCMAGPRLRLRELDPAPAPLTVGGGLKSQAVGPPTQRFLNRLKKIQTRAPKPARRRS